MKNLKPCLLFLSFLLFATTSWAQSADDLVKQGVKLHDEGKYTEAVTKYKDALKIDPNHGNAMYELAYSLYASNQPKEAMPYLQKLVNSPNRTAGAYDLLGNIYDDNNEPEKAIAAYQEGVKLNPDYQRLHYNLGISYYRQKKFAEAEQEAIAAIKLQPTHASSQRLYGLANYQQKKEIQAIVGFCSFLMLEPNSDRSKPALNFIQEIIQSKAVKTGEKSMSVFVNSQKGADSDMGAAQTAISIVAASASLETNVGKTPTELLTDQLKSIFGIAGELSAKKKVKDFFWTYYADYFYKLSQSDVMPAFTNYIALSVYKDESLAWFKKNDKALSELDAWVKLNPHTVK